MATSISDATNHAVATVNVPPVAVAITPDSASMLAGTAMRFHASVSDTLDQSVQWSVAPDADGGGINDGGLYLAPPSPGTFSVFATSSSSSGPTAAATVTAVAALPGGTDLEQSDSPAARVVPTLRMYAVWWGDPAGFPLDAESSVEGFLSALPGSRYLAIVDQYLFGSQASLTFMRNLHDPSHAPSSVNPSLEEQNAEICSVLQQEGIAPTAQDIYFLYPSTPVNRDTSPGAYCGRHYTGSCNGTNFFIAWVTTPAGSQGICSNPALAVDCTPQSAATNLITTTSAHELFETITNGLYPTWVDSRGEEIADKCGGYAYCVPLGPMTFMLPPEYSNAQHGCVAVR